MKHTVLRPKVGMQWLSTVDDGKKLELYSHTEGSPYQLATIVADDADESLWLEIDVDGKTVQIPVSLLQEAFLAAEGNVHLEAWYETNVYGSDQVDLTQAGLAYSKRGTE